MDRPERHGLSLSRRDQTRVTRVRRGGMRRLQMKGSCQVRKGGSEMEYSDYLREQAAEYRQLAEASGDPTERQDLFESAAICDEVADQVDDRRAGG